MRRELTVPFVDSRADQLVHSLASDPRDALHALTLLVDGLTVELRILGSSHQVIIDGLTEPLIETVACGVDEGLLPGQVEFRTSGFGYQFSSDVATYEPADFADRVRQLLLQLDAEDSALVGVFPGDELAVTALQLHGNDLAWKTWHCYPNTGEVVATDTVVLR